MKFIEFLIKDGLLEFFEKFYNKKKLTYVLNPITLGIDESLDGVYVLATNIMKNTMSLLQITNLYRKMKTKKVYFNSIRNVSVNNKADFYGFAFLNMLSYYVKWNVIETLRKFYVNDDDFINKFSSFSLINDKLKLIMLHKIKLEGEGEHKMMSTLDTDHHKIILGLGVSIIN